MSDSWDVFTSRLYAQNQFAIKLGLDAMRRALARLGNPERAHPVVLIAGTNGKGTTASCLSALLECSGVRTAFYSSPHLIDLSERFRVGGVPLPRADILRVGQRVMDEFAGEDADPRLTFFELTTLMAALLFGEREDVDVAIYEVGLGGRLDATNAMEPSLSVITTIGRDHERWLGDSLEDIAREKIAIARAGVPVVIGPQEHAGVLRVLCDHAPHATLAAGTPAPQLEHWGTLRGEYQRRHFHTALAAARALYGEHELAVAEAARRVRWPGRLQELDAVIEGQPVRLLLDAAHNSDGVRSLSDYLMLHNTLPDFIFCGAMKDKDVGGIFCLATSFDAQVFGVEIQSPRALDRAGLKALLPDCVLVAPLDECWSALGAQLIAQSLTSPPLILVFGSIYLLGEVFELLGFQAGELCTLAPA